MVSQLKEDQLIVKLKEYSNILKKYSRQMSNIEKDTETPDNEKILQIKKILEELSKVGTEIDNIKKEITIIRNYNLN